MKPIKPGTILAALALLALGACAQAPIGTTVPATAPVDPLAKLASFTVTDLQAASADAKSQVPPDITASQCYDFLIVTIPTIKLPGIGQTAGAFSGFQKLRDLNNGTLNPKGLLTSVNLACAPLVIDTQTVINKLLIMGAGAASGAGAAGPLLGAVGAILP